MTDLERSPNSAAPPLEQDRGPAHAGNVKIYDRPASGKVSLVAVVAILTIALILAYVLYRMLIH